MKIENIIFRMVFLYDPFIRSYFGTLTLDLASFYEPFYTMASRHLECPFCGREDFKSAKGLTQHQNRSQYCRRQLSASIYGTTGPNFASAMPKRATTTTYCSKRQKIAPHCLPAVDANNEEDIDDASFVAFDDNASETSITKYEAQFNTEIRENFRTHVSYAHQHLLPFTNAESCAIRTAKQRPPLRPTSALWNGILGRLKS